MAGRLEGGVKFLVVIPTIRQQYPGFDQVIERIRESLTLPTDFQVLDGNAGKAQTLNQALTELLPASDAEVYVTMDDDVVPSPGWQDAIATIFKDQPTFGALGLWMGDDEEMYIYMGAHLVEQPKSIAGLAVRQLMHGHHLVGCIVAMRRQVAIDVGPTPDSTERYQYWEDGWRGRRVGKLGYKQAFVEAGPVDYIRWQDTKEYQEMRNRDIASAKEKVDTFMKQGGVSQNHLTRIRQKLARIRNRT